MNSLRKRSLTNALIVLRYEIEYAFAADTASPGSKWNDLRPSTGHCVIAAIIVHRVWGGVYASTISPGASHWFNRLQIAGEYFDVDITGDQFGRPRVQVGHVDLLYPETRTRGEGELHPETWDRYQLFASRMLQ